MEADPRRGERTSADEARGERPVTLMRGRHLSLGIIASVLALGCMAYPVHADGPVNAVRAARMAASHGDFATELKLLEPLAQAGNSDAQVMLGDMYKNGDGVPTDYPKAFGWYQKAAQQGNVQAEADLGTAYFDRTSSTHSDQDMNRDYLAAARWWRKAAEQGSATAQANLGIAYELGQGVPANIADAARWFQRSAEQGNATAQYHLGIIAEYGEVGPADNAQACVWFSLAAARGNKEAAVLREALEKALTREQVEDIQSRVAEWKPRHVDMR